MRSLDGGMYGALTFFTQKFIIFYKRELTSKLHKISKMPEIDNQVCS